jgi:hypothetical protein
MTTTPTQEERDRALEKAKNAVGAAERGFIDVERGLLNLARCHLHATAELTRAEERIRLLRAALTRIRNVTNDRTLHQLALGAINELDQDDKLARGESEETKMEAKPIQTSMSREVAQKSAEPWQPKFAPGPGDRVVLVSSPDDADQSEVGKTGLLVPRPVCWTSSLDIPEGEPGSWYAFVPHGEAEAIGISRDAVFAPAPAKHAEDCNLHASHTGACRFVMWDHYHPDDCACRHCPEPGDRRPDSPAPTQAEQPPAVASGVAAGEVTDKTVYVSAGQYEAWARSVGADIDDNEREAFEAGFEAGYNAGRASRDAEVAELKRELEETKLHSKDRRAVWRERTLTAEAEMQRARDKALGLRQELEAEKAAHQRTKELYESALDCLKKAKEYASPNTPPEPLPATLPIGTRWKPARSKDWRETLGVATLATDDDVGIYEFEDGERLDLSREDINWAHWRSQQNQAPVPETPDAAGLFHDRLPEVPTHTSCTNPKCKWHGEEAESTDGRTRLEAALGDLEGRSRDWPEWKKEAASAETVGRGAHRRG